MENTYAMAYREVSEILKYLPKEEYQKVPQEEIDFFYKNSDKNYLFKIDNSVSIENQKISKKAYAILTYLFIKYIANEKQKEVINNILNHNDYLIEQEAYKKYNPDELFKSNNSENDTKTNNIEDVSENSKNIVVYKKSWIRDFWNKIKLLFKRNK